MRTDELPCGEIARGVCWITVYGDSIFHVEQYENPEYLWDTEFYSMWLGEKENRIKVVDYRWEPRKALYYVLSGKKSPETFTASFDRTTAFVKITKESAYHEFPESIVCRLMETTDPEASIPREIEVSAQYDEYINQLRRVYNRMRNNSSIVGDDYTFVNYALRFEASGVSRRLQGEILAVSGNGVRFSLTPINLNEPREKNLFMKFGGG